METKIFKIFFGLLVASLGFTFSVKSNEVSYCTTNKLGWHFHCESKEKKVPAKPKKAQPAIQTIPPITARQQLDQMNEQLEELKAEAVLSPTPENLYAYIVKHQEVLNRASDFADSWRRVIWQNPELDYLNSHPISTSGKEVWKAERKELQEDVVKSINDRFGVFFFYLSTCPVCHKYGPILRSFADRYNITVQAVRLDNGSNLPDWPETWVDSGQWNALGLTGQNVPMTVLFDKKTQEVTKIGVGVMSHNELLNRIFILTETEVGDVF